MSKKPDLMLQRTLESWSRVHPPSNNEPSKVLEVLKKRRKDLYLSKIGVAFLAGVSPRFVHDLEKGKPTVQLNKVLDVASVLHLKLVWYLPPRRLNTRNAGRDSGDEGQRSWY